MRSRQILTKKVALMLVSWIFILYPLPSHSATMWNVSDTPAQPAVTDGQALELGVKFQADINGYITGLRFYKGAANTGVHTGNLWARTGALLASATYINETASGWQEVQFSPPVAIQAGTTYVASYHSSAGYYAFTADYFATNHYTPPLRALANGEDGGNGVYKYGTSGFPTETWNSSNYWVDVVFSPSETNDTIPPTITAFTVPPTASSLTVAISEFTATDNVWVTGYLVNESSTAPLATASGWSSTVQTSYAFSTAGNKTLYAWAKDAAGNVSASMSASVVITSQVATLEPAGWYTGDLHVHRSCGGAPIDMQTMYDTMNAENLSVISLLADMGNGEVQDPILDLPKVNGLDDPISTPGRIVHWDAEWHWDATYFEYPHQALGGHILALGLSEAHQIWEEYTYPIFDWVHQQNGIAGFAHMQYLGDGIPQDLNCCGPVEYPVEVALGTVDFLSEDAINGDDSFINAYYRLLNTGFRPGFAGGSDFPCNSGVGTFLTYAQTADGELTYRNWIEGIAQGRTVISRNGHNEFLQLTVNGNATPGDQINLSGGGSVPVAIQWTANQNLTGTIELVQNGVVVASGQGSVAPGLPASLNATVTFAKSGWLAARRMSSNGYKVHTAAVFVLVDNAPVRASIADAEFYVQWIDNLLAKTSPGGDWNSYFPNNLIQAQTRYQQARAVFQQIAVEAGSVDTLPTVTLVSPADGALYVNVATPVKAVFSEPMDVATINSSTFELRDAASTLISATVSYDGTTNTATLTPVTALGESTGYTAKVLSGPAGVKDVTGNPLTSERSWSFTTAVQSTSTPHSLWDNSVIPALLSDSDTNAVELGVKFTSNADGLITALRFYKAAANTGTHVGNLWTTGGTLLASVTFTNETASGWQEMPLATPVAITAGTAYVASYHTNVGRYSANGAYFANSGFDNPPLRALANGENGANGVYLYGAGGFPNQTWNATNYWVDVVFSASLEADTTPPAVTAFTVPATATSLTVSITSLTATDNVGVTGYLVNESSAAPLATASGWSTKAPTAHTFTSAGTKTLYAWAKDTTGNVSAGRSASVTITVTDATPPTVTAFTVPATATSLTISITSLTATDNVGVTGYLVNESSAAPLATASGWSTTAPTAHAFTTAGTKTLYAWAKDATGNVSTGRSASVTITVTDVTPPTVTATSPVSNATNISTVTAVTVSFSEAMNPATINNTNLGLKNASNVAVTALVTYNASTNTATLTPAAALANATTYTATVLGGATGVADLAGNRLASNKTWSFTTAANIIPLAIVSALPPHNAPVASTGTSLNVTFNAALDAASINSTTFLLKDAANALVPAIVTYDNSKKLALLKPTNPLSATATYSATIKGGVNGVKGVSGNSLSTDYIWTFTTSASSPYGSGPGGPILLITSTTNPFSRYYAEILWAEGLNAFTIKDITTVSEAVLAQYDVAILGETALTPAQATMMTNWVTGGGNLIAMRPDKKLAGLAGLTDAGSTLSEGYLLVDTASTPGAGIVGQTIQFHGSADRYLLGGAASLATLYADAATATANPAVTLLSVGSNGGKIATFTYDLARSIVFTRQGNPAWIGQERDGILPLRSDDLFYGNAIGDPQPDWVNPEKIAIPQADEQQRLLANMIIEMNSTKKPLPRFWYFPNGYVAAVIMSGDDHGNDGTAGRFDDEIVNSPVNCSVEDWDCIRSSSYMYPDPSGAVTDAQAAAYDAAGFEIGIHLTTNCGNFTADSLAAFFTDQMNTWYTLYPSLAPQVSNRNHCIAWSGFTILPEEEAKHGIRLDVNYYYWPETWVANKPGFFTGSGMPMRFATQDGNLIDVYQAATQMTDESGQASPYTIDALLDKAIGPEEYYGVFTANMHTDYATSADYDALIASAAARGVPVISARQMLKWLDARNGSSFNALTWNGSLLSFTVSAQQSAVGLTAMVPVFSGSEITSITHNGNSVAFDISVIKGIKYATFYVLNGAYAVTIGADITPPTVSLSSPQNGAVNVSPDAAVTVKFNEPMTSATVTSTNFVLRDASQTTVSTTVTYDALTSTATLLPSAPLAYSTIYTATVQGGAGGPADEAGNTLTSDYSWSFTTAAEPTSTAQSLWDNFTTPAVISANDTSAVELGVKFQSNVSGFITALRFYKAAANTGSHVGNLWTAGGTLLASVTFANETASGWQEMPLATPVAITADTTYVASYHTSVGHYSTTGAYFASAGFANPPLRALANGENGGNGVYLYGAGGFPNQTWNAANYWVDVVLAGALGPDTTAPSVSTTQPTGGALNVNTATAVTATFSEAMDQATINSTTFGLKDAANMPVSASVTYNPATKSATLTPTAALANAMVYTASVLGGSGGVTDLAGNPLGPDRIWSFTTAAQQSSTTQSLWDNSIIPAVLSETDTNAVELGVKFQSSVNGFITALRFYKGSANTGIHVGNLWSATGTLLGSVTFTNETASGWQEMALPSAVAIAANTTYVASYHTNVGLYSFNGAYFTGSGFSNPPLKALGDGENGGNGVYLYGAGGFPNQTWNATNYWVDVVFSPSE